MGETTINILVEDVKNYGHREGSQEMTYHKDVKERMPEERRKKGYDSVVRQLIDYMKMGILR